VPMTSRPSVETGTMDVEVLKERIRELSEPVAEANGLYLYGLEVVTGRRLIVRLTAERRSKVNPRDGISVAECATLNRQIGRILDLEELIPGRWTLEVSSPGLERRLSTPEHFAGAVGEAVRLVTSSSGRSQEPVEGRLVEVGPDGVVIDVEGDRVAVALQEIRRATTVYRG